MVHQAGFEPTTDGAAIFCGFKAGFYGQCHTQMGRLMSPYVTQ